MKGHRLHVRRKMKEIMENRGLIDKKAYEDQLERLDQFSFGALSLLFLSLILLDTYSFLEHFGIGARKEKKERGLKNQERKGRIKRLQ